MRQCAPEDSISQCPFLQMIDTAGNPHADGSAAPGARPRHRPSRHRDPPATSRAHDNWMPARQTSCRQQTAPCKKNFIPLNFYFHTFVDLFHTLGTFFIPFRPGTLRQTIAYHMVLIITNRYENLAPGMKTGHLGMKQMPRV